MAAYISDMLLKKLAAKAMKREAFDTDIFKRQIQKIRVPENGKVEFLFYDGHTVEMQHRFERPEEGRISTWQQ